MAWTTPATAVVGAVLTAAWLNTNVRDNLNWLKDATPIGMILPYGQTTAPSGWLLCDGSAVSRTTYATLFVLLGTTYGNGDGSTTFNLPNLKGRTPVGYNAAETEFDALGETGGAKTHTLVTGELASHAHSIDSQGAHTHTPSAASMGVTGPGAVGATGTAYIAVQPVTDSQGSHNHTAGAAGSGTAHNNLQPYITLGFIIKY